MMKGTPALASILVIGLALTAAPVSIPRVAKATGTPGCQLGSARDQIQHVIYIQFDNVHFRRDNPNVPSDLEQMPHLLDFVRDNGTLLTNDHTILISHTAAGILSAMTGLYPDRQGQTVSNSYFYFPPSKIPAFSTSFKYWTDLVDDATGVRDPLPNMVTDGQKTTPAPWVPFTRAGCDFGAVSLANVELENTGTGAFGDMTEVFGAGSPEWNEAVASNAAPARTAARAKALTDFVGVAVHCAQGGGICTSSATNLANSRADKLPDEPGGYLNYLGLFGAKYVNPAITDGNSCVNNAEGQLITDPFGQCGFPGFDGASAKNTLAYLAQMQEAGIPITWGYISDAHDNHTSSFPAPFNPNFPRSSGPGEADYQAQLKAYDDAFAAFFERLKTDGIDQSNTLFVFTEDEGDHYVGGIGTPQPDGTLAYSHTNCSWTTTPACPANQIGEVNLNIKLKLPASTPSFVVHNDAAPAFWVSGQPDRTNPTLRQMERDVAGVNAIDPYVSSSPAPVFVRLADQVEEKTLHMVNADPARTPSFTAFGNPDYFITAASTGPSCGSNPCIDYHFAWGHGSIQDEIANVWVGFVGPGVRARGEEDIWADHTDVRPTMLTLLGLVDDYETDGRVLVETLFAWAIPQTVRSHHGTLLRLGAIYKQLNAPFGRFGMDTLQVSTRALTSGSSTDDSFYANMESAIESLTAQRDDLVHLIRHALDGAEFRQVAINEQQAKRWIDQAESLLDQAAALAGP
jgi:hypothetical protein